MNIAYHLPPPPENPLPELSAVEEAYRRILEGVADVPLVVACGHYPHGSHSQAPEDGALREKIRARALFTLSRRLGYWQPALRYLAAYAMLALRGA